jgi:hypothetical protein
MTLRVSNLNAGLIVLAAYLALPVASEASLISFGSDLGRSTMSVSMKSESTSVAPAKARTVADKPMDYDRQISLDALLGQHSNASGAGQSSAGASGVSAQCALTESAILPAHSCLEFRVCETALVLPAPHLEGMLRPPRA